MSLNQRGGGAAAAAAGAAAVVAVMVAVVVMVMVVMRCVCTRFVRKSTPLNSQLTPKQENDYYLLVDVKKSNRVIVRLSERSCGAPGVFKTKALRF